MFGALFLIAQAIYETLKISVPTVIDGALNRVDMKVCDHRLASWGHRLVKQADIRLTINGREHIPEGETFVVVSNHQSLYDIPVLFEAIPGSLRMVAKTELFRVPIWSGAMRESGFVEIDRNNHRKALESLKRAGQDVHARNIWLAPEGTRSKDGKLGKFRMGAFRLALGSGRRILPVSIEGTRHVLPKKGLKINRGTEVHVTLHPPVDPKDFGDQKRHELMNHVRSIVESRLQAEPTP